MAMVTEQAAARRPERREGRTSRAAVRALPGRVADRPVVAAPVRYDTEVRGPVAPRSDPHRRLSAVARTVPSAGPGEASDRSRQGVVDGVATAGDVVGGAAHQTARTARPAVAPYGPVRPESNRRPRARALSAVTACTVRPAARPARALVVVGILTAAVVVLLAVLGALGSSAEVPTRTAVIQVHQGDTLSGIAARSVPGGDRVAVMDRIKQLNGLTSPVLDSGQPLVVPTAAGGAR